MTANVYRYLAIFLSAGCSSTFGPDANGEVVALDHPTPVRELSSPAEEARPRYVFESLDERPISSDAFGGRPVVISFIATYDPISQLQVSYLLSVARDLPRIQFAIVALQDDAARQLVQIYRETMKVPFPVGLGDPDVIAGGGPLGDVHLVPTTVVLDRDGRLIARAPGGIDGHDLRQILARL